MKNKAYADALQATISWLQDEQKNKKAALKDQFGETLDGLKPINIVKGTVKDIVASSKNMDDLIGPMIGLVAGNLAKKLVIGKSENETRHTVGAAVQVGITTLIVQHPEELKSIGRFILQLFTKKRRVKHEEPLTVTVFEDL